MMPLCSRLLALGGAVWLLSVAAVASVAQTTGASIFGTVRRDDGSPVAQAPIVVGQRHTYADSLGRYRLDGLQAGRARVVVRSMGFSPRDTTIVFAAGALVRWDVVFRTTALSRAFEQQAANDMTSGRVDSIARKLITPNPDHALPLGAFGSRLFATIVANRGPDSNTVLSPLSAGIALSLVRFGARGTTAIALDTMLGMSELDRATIEQRGAEMMAALSRRTDVVLTTSNAVWVDTAAVLTPTFRASVERWRAATSSIPLGGESAVRAINHWTDSVTRKKISGILSEPLPDTTRLFIANAVYFNGKWLEPFEESATRPGDFTLVSGKRISIPRMARVGYMGYARAPGYQVVRLPYRTGKVAMYVVLPDSGVSFDTIVSALRSRTWIKSSFVLQNHKVRLQLPRFRTELTLDLRDPLARLGAGIAFDCDAADFSAMARPRSGRGNMPLCIGKAVQKVYIDVDEAGTEAAAVTGIGMVTVTSYSPPIEFTVDRPFLFILRDETTGADLFLGRIARP